MKLNVSFPATGCQKLFEVVDEHKLRIFYEKRMGAEVEADQLGDEWKGYVLRVAGGNDKQGFPMKQGVLTNSRVRLLMSKGHSCYRPRRDGERKRKSVRGCIVDANLSVLALVIVRKGEQVTCSMLYACSMLYGVDDVNKLTELLETVAEHTKFTYKIMNKNQIRITSEDIHIYKNIMSVIREKNLIDHIFNRKDGKIPRLVIKNLHQEIPGLTDGNVPRRLGPKRASKIRKLFNLSKEDDVRRYVVKRLLPAKEGKENAKPRYKAPRIQRLVTPVVLQRRRHRLALKKKRLAKRKQSENEYAKLLAQRKKESKVRRQEELKRRRSASMRDSKSSNQSAPQK